MPNPLRDPIIGHICGQNGCKALRESDLRPFKRMLAKHGQLVAARWLALNEVLESHDRRARRRGYELCECDLCNKAEAEMECIVPGSIGEGAGVKQPQQKWALKNDKRQEPTNGQE